MNLTSQLSPPSTKSNLVYIVDDEPLLADLIGMIIQYAGVRVQTFTDPNQALTAFRNAAIKPEVLITDYEMGKMNGVDLIQGCLKEVPYLKTMMISGSLSPEKVISCGTRIDRFIAKPFHDQELIDTVRELMARNLEFVPGAMQTIDAPELRLQH